MKDIKIDLNHLSKLSNIKLNDIEKQRFESTLSSVINKLDELSKIKLDNNETLVDNYPENTLRTLSKLENQKQNSDIFVKNIKHEVINNSVVIKSVLS